jgi:ATP-binding cassette subfamily B protein
LLRVSVRENIRLARPDASDAEVLEAARAANIAAEIEALPRGLDTVYGDETQLSGGQAQRIAIARAVLADAPVLVLDEALAATDADAEAEIQSALNRLVADRTVLVVAHRPESVRGADQVLLLDRGRIVQRLRGDEVTDAALDRIMESEATRA